VVITAAPISQTGCGRRWAPRAAEIGWDAVSLFGCHPLRPVDYLGCAGLLWHIGGRKLIALRKDWAVLATTDGAERVFHRRPVAPKIVLPWRLR
jgi:hypothetical protein